MLVNGRLERSVARFGVVRLAVVLALGALWVAFAVLSLWSTNTLLHLDVDSFLSQPGMSVETRAQLAQAAFVLRSLKAISWQVMATVGLLASALFAVVLIVVARMFRAQSISLWGLKVEASTEAAQLAERVYLAERTLAALAENIGEFQSLGVDSRRAHRSRSR